MRLALGRVRSIAKSFLKELKGVVENLAIVAGKSVRLSTLQDSLIFPPFPEGQESAAFSSFEKESQTLKPSPHEYCLFPENR
jgi:hypothetical protein